MILQLLRQFNNLDRSKTIACSASFRFGLSLRFPCPLPKRISSRILSKSVFISQNHPKSQQRVRTCAVIEKPVFRASLALSMLEIELYQISLPYDRGRSGYEISRHRHRHRHRLYYDSSIRGYSVVIYNTKIMCIKIFIKVGIYTCITNKNIYIGNTEKRLYKIN